MKTQVSDRLTAAEGRRFGLTLGAAFIVMGGVLWWRGRAGVAGIALGLGVVLFLAGVAVPSRLGPVQRAWLGFGAALSRVTTPVFLGIVYFAVIAPIGFVMRVTGRNPLTRHRRDASRWVPRPAHARSRRDMQRLF